MSMRLQKVLPFIINEDRTGYIKGRFIGQNIRIIEDVVYFTETENLPSIILTTELTTRFGWVSVRLIPRYLGHFPRRRSRQGQ